MRSTTLPSRLLLAAALASATSAGHAGPAQDAAAAGKAIRAAYANMDAAIGKKDLRGAFAFYTPDFKVTYQGATIPLQQQVADAQRLFKQAAGVKSRTTVQKVMVNGGSATVTAAGAFSADIKDAASGKTKPFRISGVAQDTWVKTGAGWRIRRSTVLKQSTAGMIP